MHENDPPFGTRTIGAQPVGGAPSHSSSRTVPMAGIKSIARARERLAKNVSRAGMNAKILPAPITFATVPTYSVILKWIRSGKSADSG